MAESLDMALDEIIRNKKRLRGPTKGPLRGSPNLGSPGPARRLPSLNSARAVPYAPRSLMPMLSPILEEQRLIAAGAESESGVKLYISNLDYGVTNHDIMLLFSDIGDLKLYGIHCDRSGRSKGKAEVVFKRKTDAIAAIKRFNNVKLHGKPMHIEIVGDNHLVQLLLLLLCLLLTLLLIGIPFLVNPQVSLQAEEGRCLVVEDHFKVAVAVVAGFRWQRKCKQQQNHCIIRRSHRLKIWMLILRDQALTFADQTTDDFSFPLVAAAVFSLYSLEQSTSPARPHL